MKRMVGSSRIIEACAEISKRFLTLIRLRRPMNKPSKANEEVFYLTVERVAAAAQEMLNSLVTTAEPRDREVEAERAKARAANGMDKP